ncbi:hypothetical protein DNH61_12415 [Paenibacillus sambharensis]|uniref:Uncharacterized protein n=1 Tax=Paenibacillus sambharensis TaxID=1803190 RepID=A0A2W1LU83_9BACL|nr:hypothetical protein [Paenibacillus sambharensis]PZD95341.1 hypothetical protein DNH61_12415 [Paenibacillus sambharensis]
MNVMKKRMGRIGIVIALLFSVFSTGAMASNAENGPVSDEVELITAYEVTENGLVEISKDKYLEIVRENEKREKDQRKGKYMQKKEAQESKKCDEVTIACTGDFFVFSRSGTNSSVLMNSKKEIISQRKYNDTVDNMSWGFISSTMTTYQANISLTIGKKDAITAVIGGSWQQSKMYSDTVTATIRPGYTAWVEFTPYMKNDWGYLEKWNYCAFPSYSEWYTGTKEWVDLYTPTTLSNGQSNGFVTVVARQGKLT